MKAQLYKMTLYICDLEDSLSLDEIETLIQDRALNGVSHTIAEWAEILGIKKTTIKERLKRGWSDEKALTTPVRKRSADMRGTKNG